MKTVYLPVCALLLSLNVSAQANILVKGFGITEQDASIDAKKQLALQISTQIEVSEKNVLRKHANDVTVEYIQESKISSLPVDIPAMDVEEKKCGDLGCEYTFSLNSKQWLEQVNNQITTIHRQAEISLAEKKKGWEHFISVSSAKAGLLESERMLPVFGFLSSSDNDYLVLAKEQAALVKQVALHEQAVRVSLRASSDSYAKRALGLLAAGFPVSDNGDFIIYVKGSSKSGTQGSQFVALQNIELAVIAADSPGVVITRKVISEMASSSVSKARALEAAQKKITTYLEKHSIYSLLHTKDKENA